MKSAAKWLLYAMCLMVVVQTNSARSLEQNAPVSVAGLPIEARETLALIKADGPFPYAQDGTTFQNREKHLPPRERGYYREYTVRTPGAKDRGARRVVAGRGGELYYTEDHYRSFRRIIE